MGEKWEVKRDKELGGSNYVVTYDGVKVGEIFRKPDWDVQLGLRWAAIDTAGEYIWEMSTLREMKESLDTLFEKPAEETAEGKILITELEREPGL